MVSGTAFDFPSYVQDKRSQLEACLAEYLSGNEPPALWDSMRYSVLEGGKRIRAMLCFASAEAVAADASATASSTSAMVTSVGATASSSASVVEVVMPCACAIEMVHAMSLIHDDLPVMDNDDFRRGRPTNHKVYGEALALLAGDALLVRATEVLARHTPPVVDRQTLVDVIAEFARVSGAYGLVGGQVDDLAFSGQLAQQLAQQIGVDEKTLRSIHQRKTGALLSFCSWSGAYLVGARGELADAFKQFGELLGLAFQITDDLLDVTGDIKTLGKTPGKDEAAQKATWVRMFGVEKSRRQVADLQEQLEELLRQTCIASGGRAALNAIVDYVVTRQN